MFRSQGIRVGSFLGIPIYLHPTWFILLVLVTLGLNTALLQFGAAPGGLTYVYALATALAIFACLLAHEYGHALTARVFGIGTDRITLFIVGGVAQIKDEPRQPLHEFLIAVAGPAISMLCAILFYVATLLIPESLGPLMFAALVLAQVNLVFAVFNMLPGFPMDGGRVLRSLIWYFTGDYLRSTRIASWGGQGLSWLLMGFGFIQLFLSFGGFMYIILGYFLGRLARMALRQAEMRAAFDHVSVKDLMRPVQVVVPAEATIRQVVENYVYRLHADRFPVVRGRTLLGYVSSDDIVSVPREQWDRLSAERLARPYRRGEILTPYQNALKAFQTVTVSGRPNMPVFNDRQLVGFLFQQDVVHYLKRFT